MGAMVGPEAFTEVRYLAHHKQLRALQLIPQLSVAFAAQFGRASGGLIRTYRTSDADTIVVSLGSVNGTVQEVVDELRDSGQKIGSVGICSFRPFPLAALREVLQNAKRVVVLEKCLAVGLGGIVSDGVRKSLSGVQLKGYTVIAGLGGRAITRASLRQLFLDAAADELEQVTFLDLNADVVAGELEREQQARRTGPTAEAILRRLGMVGSKIG
jgi:pyruvate ferredoxin oxidoreductase alpha subunit